MTGIDKIEMSDISAITNVSDLPDLWDRQRATYPDTGIGLAASQIVGVCAEELRVVLMNTQRIGDLPDLLDDPANAWDDSICIVCGRPSMLTATFTDKPVGWCRKPACVIDMMNTVKGHPMTEEAT